MTQLLPNLGGEEGPGWRSLLAEPAVAAQAGLWRWLFPDAASWLYEPTPPVPWPDALGAPPGEAVFPWLAGFDGVVPWIVTEDARSDERASDAVLQGPSAEIVRRVHDKAFAHGVALEERLVPAILRDAIVVLEPDALRAPDAADRIDARLAGLPAFARERFTLKPRIGTSGRGRIAGRDGLLDRATLGAGLQRLADRGGALLEPWLERRADLSVQLHAGDEGVTVLGSLEQVLAPSGRYLGHRGELDSRGRVFSGHGEEESLREAAALVGAAAREAGYRGPCGVDAFVFAHPETGEDVLRGVVELNARFTAGTVVVGLVRRALPWLKAELGLRPGERLQFEFALSAPESADRDGGVLRFGEDGPRLTFRRVAP